MEPYRNQRIIKVIRELYFMGYPSFAGQFEARFPVHQGPTGETKQEVPVPMVMLVATALSVFKMLQVMCGANMDYQLYVTLREWHSGERQAIDFSANSYLDVYIGNMDSINLYRENHNAAYHDLMAYIYSQAWYWYHLWFYTDTN